MKRWVVRPGKPLRGTLRVPGDLQVGQQALVWAALAEGQSLIAGLSERKDHALLSDALRAMGVAVARTPAGIRIQGVGLRGLRIPSGALKAGASTTTLEILTALLAPQHFGTRIEAEGPALSHSLRTLITPLRARGANVAGRNTDDGDVYPPVSAAPLLAEESLAEVEIEIPDGDATTKLGLLLSGLYVRGCTGVMEGVLSVDHAERALMSLGAGIETQGAMTLLDRSERNGTWPGFEWHVPGDFSLACFLIAAALAVPGSAICIEGVGLNRTRTAFLDVLRHTGAQITVVPKGDTAGDEPVGDIYVESSTLRSALVYGELGTRVAGDATALLALAPCLRGKLTVRELASLRSRTPDPLKGPIRFMRDHGFECTDYADGFDLHPCPGRAATLQLGADASASEILLATVLALSGKAETQIDHAQRVDALYPGFEAALAGLGADITWEDRT